MRKSIIFITVITIIKIIFFSKVSAALRINEIYPAPVTGEFEWVEIINDGEENIDLTNYFLTDLLGNKLKFETATASAGFTIATSSGVLNNSGDTVILKNLNQEVDVATYSGSFSSDDSYNRCPDRTGSFYKLNTQTKNSSNNTSCLVLTPTTTPSPIPSPTSIPTPTHTPTPTKNPTPAKIPSPIHTARQQITLIKTQTPERNIITTRKYIAPLQNIPIAEDEEVLGEETEISEPTPKKNNTSKTFSLVSASYSLLTIFSVFLKMKAG